MLVCLSDNRDIVTDTREDALPVVPKGGSAPIPFMPRGASNNLPYDVMNRIGVNVTVGSNVEFKNKVIYGDSLLVYRRYRDENGKIRKEEVLPGEAPDVFEFLELIITQALHKMYQDATLQPLYFVKKVNRWPQDIYFSVTNCQLTTLDKGTGAVKNTGIPPINEEQ